jgi:predicted TIM-barrel fold metal-dependent hydrolase
MASCFEIIHFFLEEAIKRAPEKVIFGSDSPNLPPSMELKRIEVMKLDPAQHRLVVGGTLANILKL